MTGKEISAALSDLNSARRRHQKMLMQDYDENVYRPALRVLLDACPHEDNDVWENNGIGYSWTHCKWCEKRMRQNSFWDEVKP